MEDPGDARARAGLETNEMSSDGERADHRVKLGRALEQAVAETLTSEHPLQLELASLAGIRHDRQELPVLAERGHRRDCRAWIPNSNSDLDQAGGLDEVHVRRAALQPITAALKIDVFPVQRAG